MKIEAFYDVSCSWCRVAKANLHHVIEKLVKEGKIKEDDIEITYRGYVLHPEVPSNSTELKIDGEHPVLVKVQAGGDYKAAKIADDDTADWDPKKNTPIHNWAKRAGINFEFDRITVSPNTWKAHQLLYLIRDIKPEAFEPLLSDMQQAWFEDGLNVNDLDVLCALAKKYVNDIYPLKQRVLAGEKREEVRHDTEDIGDTKYDLQLMPMLVFDEKVKLEGAILPAKMEKAILGQLDPNVPGAK